MMRVLFLTPLILLQACLGELEASHLVTRPRILAIKAEPPQMIPGQTIRLSALLATPPGETVDAENLHWIDCGSEGSAEESRDLCRDAPARQLGTGLDLDYSLPEDFDDSNLAELSFNGGYWQRVSLEFSGVGDQRERAFKRVVVTVPALPGMPLGAPNRNPSQVVPSVEVLDDKGEVKAPLADGEKLKFDTAYRFSFELAPEDREPFTRRYLDLRGLDLTRLDSLTEEEFLERLVQEETLESLRMRAFSNDGDLGESQLATTKKEGVTEGEVEYYPAQIDWQLRTVMDLPDGTTMAVERSRPLPSIIKIWFIVMDGRGGLDWLEWQREIEP